PQIYTLSLHDALPISGAINRKAYLSVVNFSASYKGKGRLPTTDISPVKTFHNCGSSSILVFLINFPTRVIRGSSLIFTKTGAPRSEEHTSELQSLAYL